MPTPQSTWSRRSAMRLFATLPVCLAMLAGTTTQALAKAAKKAVRYQDEPKKGRNCAGCRHFQAPNACKLVDGEISANGWCTVWAKAKS